ncbi:hypothetical protein [Nonomuraea wenchangensis]|uniref:Uncharacterized protein n=1 Tax=Nonomuraea wenchangensis TaxID=568860 RepID=A0A1I0LTG9_9ACTN|nr:hypothetical protein [Nonomuraea wenchangensis]SEU46422.1 hypothetical protein SAMN05421811_12730 [Nonomuraea wenchangensis]
MSPARPAHEQPGAVPSSVPHDAFGGIILDTTGLDPDTITWEKPKPFPALLRLHHTHGLRGTARYVLWKDVHGPATYPMFADDLPRTIRGTVIDHGVAAALEHGALVAATWVPITRRGQYGIALKGFHEQEPAAPETPPASPADEAAARYIDREHAVRLILATLGHDGEDDVPPGLADLIHHIREDQP